MGNAGGTGHPLFDDPDRLERVLRVAYQRILKTLGLNPISADARALHGGVSPEDILQEVTEALWKSGSDELPDSWEALGVAVAHNKTVDAVRRATRGRRQSAEEGGEIDVVSLDRPLGSDGEDGLSGAERLSGGRSAEEEFFAMYEELLLWEVAQGELDERELKVFYELHYLGPSRKAVGEELGLSGQRIGQIYAKARIRLQELVRTDPRYAHLWDRDPDDDEAGDLDAAQDVEDDSQEGEA